MRDEATVPLVVAIVPVKQFSFPLAISAAVSISQARLRCGMRYKAYVPLVVATVPLAAFVLPVQQFSFPPVLEDAPIIPAPAKVLIDKQSFVSKSTLGYSRIAKDKEAKQLHKKKVMLGVKGETKFAMKSCRGNEESILIAIDEEGAQDVYAPKVKGKRELKNLECSVNFEARGGGSSRVRDAG
jgi:hypothetical protein